MTGALIGILISLGVGGLILCAQSGYYYICDRRADRDFDRYAACRIAKVLKDLNEIDDESLPADIRMKKHEAIGYVLQIQRKVGKP